MTFGWGVTRDAVPGFQGWCAIIALGREVWTVLSGKRGKFESDDNESDVVNHVRNCRRCPLEIHKQL